MPWHSRARGAGLTAALALVLLLGACNQGDTARSEPDAEGQQFAAQEGGAPSDLTGTGGDATSATGQESRSPTDLETATATVEQRGSGTASRNPDPGTTESTHAPYIRRMTRSNGDDPLRPRLVVSFSQPMDQDSTVDAIRTEPPIELRHEWRGRDLWIEPAEPLGPGARHTVSIDPDAESAAGLNLRGRRQTELTTPSLVRLVGSPRSLAEPEPLRLRFLVPMDPDSVEASLDASLDVALSWDEDGQGLELTPTQRLEDRRKYRVSFKAPLRAKDDRRFSAPDAVTFTAPSAVKGANLKGSDADSHRALTIEFHLPLDLESLGAALEVSPDTEGAVDLADPRTLRFTPTAGFEPETTYTVTVAATARSADGGPLLRSAYRHTFRTGPYRPAVSFGHGARMQVVPTGGSRRVSYAVMSPAELQTQFRLYSLSEQEFLDLLPRAAEAGWRWENAEPLVEDAPAQGSDPVWSQSVDLPPADADGTADGGTDYYRARSVEQLLIPESVPTGLYLLEVRTAALDDQLLLALSRDVITLKAAQDQATVWVKDASGEPVAGAEVSVRAGDGEVLAEGLTGSDGLFQAEGPDAGEADLVLARTDAGVTVVGTSPAWHSRNGDLWEWYVSGPAEAKPYAVHVVTDRPLYRPGQTAHYRVVVRQDDDAVLGLPAPGTPITVRIKDPKGNTMKTETLPSSDFGTASGELAVAEGVVLGQYSVDVEVDGTPAGGGTFQVEDYKKPEMSVSVQVPEAAVSAQPLQVTGTVTYFHGTPAVDTKLSFRRYELVSRWDGAEADPWVWNEMYGPDLVASTDSQGRFTATLEAAHVGDRDWWRASFGLPMAVEVTADDGTGQTVSATDILTVYPHENRVEIEGLKRLVSTGEAVTVRGRLLDLDGAPVSGGRVQFRAQRWTGSDPVTEDEVSVTTGEDGRAEGRLTLTEPGWYEIVAESSTTGASASTYTHAVGDGEPLPEASTAFRISAEEEAYAPGDTAGVTIESYAPGPALLTVERGTVRRTQIVRLTPPLTTVDLPIQPTDMPNVFVSVAAWQPSDGGESDWYGGRISQVDQVLRTDTVELEVSAASRELRVTVAPETDAYRPRDEATLAVTVTDAAGNPVAAEVSIAVADEAALSLARVQSEDIFDAFYRRRGHGVVGYDTLALRRYMPCECGGGGGGGFSAANPRSEFADTALWVPAVVTDENGRAEVTFDLPDDITTWRATAVAVDASDRFGQAEASLKTRQPVVLTPLMPRSTTAGDEVLVSAAVQNSESSDLALLVGLIAPELGFDVPSRQRVRLAAGERRIVGWPVRLKAPGTFSVTLEAVVEGADPESDFIGDAVQVPLEVAPLAVPDVSSWVGQVDESVALNVELPVNAARVGEVEISLTRSLAGSLLEGVDYLIGFPYGCVEQTMSKALPNAVVARALRNLGSDDPSLAPKLDEYVEASIHRLYGFQHDDGGWGWWHDDPSDAYQTAWVVFGLAVTADAGYEVDPAVIERGVSYLKGQQMDPRTQAFALYAATVAGRPDAETAVSLAENPEALDAFGLAALALSLDAAGREEAAQSLVDDLIESADRTGGAAHWGDDADDGRYRQKTMASDVRNTAMVLRALVSLRPGHALEGEAVRWLMAQRQPLRGWGTTNETSFAMLALTDHLTRLQSEDSQVGWEVSVNGQAVGSGTLEPGQNRANVQIPAADLTAGANGVTLRRTSGSGPLYYAVASRFLIPEPELPAAGDVAVRRTYQAHASGPGSRTGGAGSPREDSPSGSSEGIISSVHFAHGDLVEVTVTVDMPRPAAYVMIEDKLPGGLEALNEGLATTSRVSDGHGREFQWQDLGYNHKEVRADRVTFFVTDMPEGRRTFSYLARATRPGSFTALPAEVSAMYDATVWGRSASTDMAVGPRPVQVSAVWAGVGVAGTRSGVYATRRMSTAW